MRGKKSFQQNYCLLPLVIILLPLLASFPNTNSNMIQPFVQGFVHQSPKMLASSSSFARHVRLAGARGKGLAQVGVDRPFSAFISTPQYNQHCHHSRLTVQTRLQNARFATAPTFLDENQSDPKSYSVPTHQPGMDVLTDIPKGQRIVSFGDVHGDILALYHFLQASKLLHDNSTLTNPIWDGGETILVQCGDILDRGPNELFCLRYMASLARQASDAGGRVVLLHGNHEALNANGLFQYTDPKGDEEIEVVLGKTMDQMKSDGSKRWRIQYAGNQPARWSAFEPGGWLSEPLLSNMYVAAIVGRSVFVHAGLTKKHLDTYNDSGLGDGGSIEKMNESVRTWFGSSLPDYLLNDDGSKFQSVEQVIDNANLRARTTSQSMPECLGGGIGAASPVWMRDYSSPADGPPKDPHKAQKMIDDCLEELSKQYYDTSGDNGVQRMVMGHTPQNQINAALRNKAWRVDVGASKGVMNGTPEVLEIIHRGGKNDEDLLYVLTVDGERIPATERQIVEIPF